MKPRHSAGSILSLTAWLTLALVLIGTIMFFLAQLLGGSRELSIAADAGALNVAKAAITNPTVTVYPTPDKGLKAEATDFFALCDQPSSGANSISLLSYNRLLAQTLLVTTNAQAIVANQPLATGAIDNAGKEVLAAQSVGNAFRNAFASQSIVSQFNTDFLNIADDNNLKMLGGQSTVQLSGQSISNLQTKCMKKGGSANVYFDPTIFSTVVPGADPFATYHIPLNGQMNALKPAKAMDGNYKSAFYEVPSNDYKDRPAPLYVAGYTPVPVLPGTAYATNLYFAVNEPQQNPHLVSIGDFDAAPEVVDPSVPPNAFKIDCQAADRTIKGPLTTTACSIVGCTNTTFPVPHNDGISGPKNALNGTDYVGSIPAGFIRIVELPDMNAIIIKEALNLPIVPNTLYDGLTYIFNSNPDTKNLADRHGGGAWIDQVPVPLPFRPGQPSRFFVTDRDGGEGAIKAWSDYNNSYLPSTSQYADAWNHDQRMDPNWATINGVHTGMSPYLYSKDPNRPQSPIHTGPRNHELATLDMVLFHPGIRSYKGGFELNSLSIDNARPWVVETLNDIMGNFGSDIATVVGPKNAPTILEYLKGLVEKELYEATDHKSFHFTFTITPQLLSKAVTGLKFFNHFHDDGSPVPHASPNWYHGGPTAAPTFPEFGNDSGRKPATPLQLLEEINATAHHRSKPVLSDRDYNDFIDLIAQRCKQMSPALTRDDVLAALNSNTIEVEHTPATLYLHLDLMSPTPRLVLTPTLLDNAGNSYDSGLAPDSWVPNNSSISYPTYEANYTAEQFTINTRRDDSEPTAIRADMNLEYQAYEQYHSSKPHGTPKGVPAGTLRFKDGAVFYASSGFGNLLGEVHFFQQPLEVVTSTWSAPN